MTRHLVAALLVILSTSNDVNGARILGLFPYGAKSHFQVSGALMKGLALRGHQVVVVSHFPQTQAIPNYTDISLVGSMPTTVNSIPIDEVATGKVSTNMAGLIKLGLDACETTLASEAVKTLLKSEEKFDLIVTEFFNTDCLLGFVHKFKIPFIAIGTSVILPWTNSRFGNPDNPSYMPSQFSESSDRMTFYERLLNTLYQEVLKWTYDIYITRPSQEIARRFFGEDLPSLEDIARNASLLLMNTHFTITKPRPFVPAIVEIAGIHIGPSQPLPQDLKKFLDEAEHGVIYFTLGSQVRVDSIPEEKRNALMWAFSQLPQRVLWKWEGGRLPGQPSNVMTAKWLPQVDVLCHPSVRVFVTHAGLLGTIEAAHCGVPMVTIPLFGDQDHNAACLVSAGVARNLKYQNIDKNSFLDTLSDVVNNDTYGKNAKRLQRAFRDRPTSPLDTAIFWTEYIIRHNGAPHIRSAAIDLNWLHYLLLDVIAVLLIPVALLLYTLYKIIGLCKYALKVKRKHNTHKKNK